MKIREWFILIFGGLLTGVVTVATFLFSFGFYMAFWPFITLYGMIRDFMERKRNSEGSEKEKTAS